MRRKPIPQTERVSFDKKIEGLDLLIEFTRSTVFGTELYGSDADGNRGMWIDTVDEDEPLDVRVSWENPETGNAHNPIPFDELPAFLRTPVQDAIGRYLEDHEPVAQEQMEPDPDREYDRDPED